MDPTCPGVYSVLTARTELQQQGSGVAASGKRKRNQENEKMLGKGDVPRTWLGVCGWGQRGGEPWGLGQWEEAGQRGGRSRIWG